MKRTASAAVNERPGLPSAVDAGRRMPSAGLDLRVSPHDLRRTAITRALDSGLSYRQAQMMSKHKDPKTVMRYDHGRENPDRNAVNFLGYEDEE